MDIEGLRTKDGKLVPATLELSETSGPVSPRFQYTLNIAVRARGDRVRLHYVRTGLGGDADVKRSLPRARYEALWRELLLHDVFHREADLTPTTGGKRVGVSYNHFALELGKRKVRFEYLLPRLQEPDHAAYLAIVDTMKKLAEEPAPAG